MKNFLTKSPNHIIGIIGFILLCVGIIAPILEPMVVFNSAAEIDPLQWQQTSPIVVVALTVVGLAGYFLFAIYVIQWVVKILRNIFLAKSV
jgi:hypothetical protein